eukprot:13162012-Alexandrium_andersonii.AAC.1
MASSTPPNFRRASRQSQAIADFEVKEDVDVSHGASHQKQDVAPMRWVHVQKAPVLTRCRLAAQDFKERIPDKDLVFAATSAFFTLLILLAVGLQRD